MISAHLPVLQVAMSMVAAPLCMVLHRGRPAWVLSVAVSWASLACAVALLLQVMDGGTVTYAFGGWAAPVGIEYRIDILNGFVLLIVAAISAVVVPYSLRSAADEIAPERLWLFYAVLNLLLAGLFGIAITGDLFNVFVFLEISSLASYALVSLGRDRRALTAAFRYLILGTLGATFLLIGIGLLYAATGTLNMADIADRVAGQLESRTVLAAFAFLTVGISLKAALFPLHTWLPGAYAYAPSAVTALLAATATKVAVYLLLRMVFLFGPDFIYDVLPLSEVIVTLALLGVLSGSAAALFQTDVKRLLAYSSVAHVGYMLLGIGLGGMLGLGGGIVHMFNHAMAKGAVFLAVGCIVLRVGSSELGALQGIGRRMPWTMAAFVIAGFSLIGVPLTAGFVGKWYLVLAAMERGWWWVAAALLIAGALSVLYLWRVVEQAYFHEPRPANADAAEAPLSMLVPLWVLAAASVYFGIDTTLNAGLASRAAAAVLGMAP